MTTELQSANDLLVATKSQTAAIWLEACGTIGLTIILVGFEVLRSFRESKASKREADIFERGLHQAAYDEAINRFQNVIYKDKYHGYISVAKLLRKRHNKSQHMVIDAYQALAEERTFMPGVDLFLCELRSQDINVGWPSDEWAKDRYGLERPLS